MRWPWKKGLRKMLTALLPWPAKDERAEAIREARRERERSQAAARRAAEIEQQIRRMSADNHFAQMIARHLRGHQ